MASKPRNIKKGLRKSTALLMTSACGFRSRWPRAKFLFLCLVASFVALKTLLSSPTSSNSSFIAKNGTNPLFQVFLHYPTKPTGNNNSTTNNDNNNKSSHSNPSTSTAFKWKLGEIFTNSSLHPRGHLPMLFVVTPTYRRLEQIAELTRLAQTLMHVPALHWIVVEDAIAFSASVRHLLRRVGVNFTHMLGPKPAMYSPGGSVPSKKLLPRGVSNRVAALRWVQSFVTRGVLYFADDDNSYDIRLFEEMRLTKKVSMWPVGLVTHLAVSSPVVSGGKVVGFYDGWIASRKFPVDMAGFAVNISFLLQHPNVTMPFSVGYEEDGFLRSLGVTLDDIEPRASNCTEVLVWHTKTVSNKPPKKLSKKEFDKYSKTNIVELQANMW